MITTVAIKILFHARAVNTDVSPFTPTVCFVFFLFSQTDLSKLSKKSKAAEVAHSHNFEERLRYSGAAKRLSDFEVPPEEVPDLE